MSRISTSNVPSASPALIQARFGGELMPAASADQTTPLIGPITSKLQSRSNR
jgi:hypothetical protein